MRKRQYSMPVVCTTLLILLYMCAAFSSAAFGGVALGSAVLSNTASLPTGSTFQNPLGPRIPDPFILHASDGRYYAYGTTGFKAWSSPDLVNWKSEGVVYQTTTKSWGLGSFWAPEVVEYAGKFYLFYTADYSGNSKRIGVAVSSKPTGPFTDYNKKPLFDFGYGVIDPHVLIDDDGRKYLYYSRAMSENEVSPGRFESFIYVIELDDDLLSVHGDPTLLTKPVQSWELSGSRSFWNEGAAVFKRNGVYYLMWSANSYTSNRYAVGFATSSSPMGPFKKYESNPILSASAWGNQLSGPGHNGVTMSPDGSEWYIVYHTHIDPLAGGGPRQLNIDRMGFRADGSIYVNGPTLTPQPTPAGNNELRNISGDATVTASSVAEGYRIPAVVDGEIGVDSRFSRYDWVSAAEGVGAWVQLTWASSRHISSLFIYDSALSTRKIKKGHVVLSDGTTIKDIEFPNEPGAAAIVTIPNTGITWVRFVVDELVGDNTVGGLSEIMAMGYPMGNNLLGGAWISSPQPGATVGNHTPLRIEGTKPTSAQWTVELDDKPIYQGNAYPEGLVLDAASLAQGSHNIQVKATGPNGEVATLASSFTVEHLKINSPQENDTLTSTTTLSAQFLIDQADIKRVTVSVVGSSPEGTQIDQQVYSGMEVPGPLTLDTFKFADGSYQVKYEVTTKAGIHSVLSRQVLIDNFVTLEDPLLPPVENGWFGLLDRGLTSERSSGWKYAEDSPADFFNDADRLHRQQPTEEYLVWKLDNLKSFRLSLYTKDPLVISKVIKMSVSADGQQWSPVAYEVKDLGLAASSWHQVQLGGDVSLQTEAGLLRLEMAASQPGDEMTDVQLGHVVLTGYTK